MHKLKYFTSLIPLAFLCACGGGSDNDTSQVTLALPNEAITQSNIPLDSLIIEIVVNGGRSQKFRASELGNSVSVSGLQSGRSNIISVLWLEDIDGYEMPLSWQLQDIEGISDTSIDSTHVYDPFDYDNDGVANFYERVNGTCVWSADTACSKPEAPNIFVNSTFTNGSAGWWSDNEDEAGINGEYCVRVPAISDNDSRLRIGYGRRIDLQSDVTYELSFDVKADNANPLDVEFFYIEQGSYNLIDTEDPDTEDSGVVNATEEYQRITMNFYSEVTSVNGGLVFKFGGTADNRYCLDNLSLTEQL